MSDDSTASKPDTSITGPVEPAEALPQTIEPQPVVSEPAEPDAVEQLPAAPVLDPEPAVSAPELIEPEPPAAADTAAIDSVVADPAATAVVLEEPVAPAAALPAASAVSVQQPVYVQAPVPPKKRGNRGIGVLLSVVGAILYAGLYAVVGGFIIDFRDRDLFGSEFVDFLGSAFFWVPVIVFLVGLILMALLLNRAGWWAHVFGSLILAIVLYLATIGILLLIANVFHGASQPITFASLAINPWVIGSAIVAREASIWIGLAIAARGRRVKSRNAEARAAFEREQAAKNSEYAGPIAGN